MKTSLTGFALLAGAALLGAAIGCGQQTQPAAPAADSHSHAKDDHSSTEHGVHAGSMSHHHEATDIETEMAKLSPEDRALAEKQKICPVSDDPLGAMGTPIKVTVDGKDIFVCCQGCVDPVKNDFAKYAAKLDKMQ